MGTSSKRIAPLVEIVLVIFFFALLSAVTLQMFAAAYKQSSRSEALSVAAVVAQNTAEQFKNGTAPKDAAFTPLENGGIYQIYYDKDFKSVSTGGRYMLELYYTKGLAAGGKSLTGRVTVYESSDSEVLMELKLGDYQPE